MKVSYGFKGLSLGTLVSTLWFFIPGNIPIPGNIYEYFIAFFLSFLKLKPSSFISIPQKSLQKIHMSAISLYLLCHRRNVLLRHDEFKPSMFHQRSVCSYFPVSMTECCWVKDSTYIIQNNALILIMFYQREKQQQIPCLTTSPTHKFQNKR